MHARDTGDSAHAAEHGRVVLVAGASGLVGRVLVAGLCADPDVARVHALVRRPVDLQVGATLVAKAFARERAPTTGGLIRAHDIDVPAIAMPKLQQHVVAFDALPALPRIDEAYLALGTTIAVAGSREAFRAVDFDANLAVARAALAAGARRIGLVSAMGADSRSRVFYSRAKGELEDALSALPLDALVIARPSLLLGDRDRLGQPRRRGEHLAASLNRWLRPLIPARLRGIAAEDVASALVAALPQASGRQVLESHRMQGAARD